MLIHLAVSYDMDYNASFVWDQYYTAFKLLS